MTQISNSPGIQEPNGCLDIIIINTFFASDFSQVIYTDGQREGDA